MWLLYEALISVYGSARQVEAELAHPLVWNLIRDLVRDAVPATGPTCSCPAQPMRRHHYLYARNRYLTDPDVLAALADAHRELAADQARELGLLDPDGPGLVDPSRPQPDAPRRRQGHHSPLQGPARRHAASTRTTGEILPTALRTRRGAALRRRRQRRLGHQVRPRRRPHRPTSTAAIILDVEWVPTPGGEARTAIDCFTRLAPHIPGAQGVIYDTALRGVHHQTPAARPRAAPHQPGHRRQGQPQEAPPRRTTRREERPHRRQDHHRSPTARRHTLRALRATAARSASANSPTPATSLHRTPPHPHPPQPRQERPVPLVQRLPTPRPTTSDQTITVRLHGNDDDTGPEVQPHREPPAHPTRRPRLRTALPPPQRRRVHQPRPRRHPLARPRPQHRPRPPTPQPPRLRAHGQLARAAPPPATSSADRSPPRPTRSGQPGTSARRTRARAPSAPRAAAARPERAPETPASPLS